MTDTMVERMRLAERLAEREAEAAFARRLREQPTEVALRSPQLPLPLLMSPPGGQPGADVEVRHHWQHIDGGALVSHELAQLSLQDGGGTPAVGHGNVYAYDYHYHHMPAEAAEGASFAGSMVQHYHYEYHYSHAGQFGQIATGRTAATPAALRPAELASAPGAVPRLGDGVRATGDGGGAR